MTNKFNSWGNDTSVNQRGIYLNRLDKKLTEHSYLAQGNGRSYGDSCLNQSGVVASTKNMNHIVDFDKEKGTITCESGVTIYEILRALQGTNWKLSVVPGTGYVTVGGAIANDVHGKNHTNKGTFGCHINSLELLRSDSGSIHCSKAINNDLFRVTIGGLGLTGIIRWAEIQLEHRSTNSILSLTKRCKSLEELTNAFQNNSEQDEFKLGWIDGHNLKNLTYTTSSWSFSRNHKKTSDLNLAVPFTPNRSLISKNASRAFNYFYSKTSAKAGSKLSSHESFYFPLDGLRNWNRLYGTRGLIQFQCLVPKEHSLETLTEIFKIIKNSGAFSPLIVLKQFGEIKSPGMMSFPKEGLTLALDFNNNGNKTRELVSKLERVIISKNGRLYPAKDLYMSSEGFIYSYPMIDAFIPFIDPSINSDFWERVRP